MSWLFLCIACGSEPTADPAPETTPEPVAEPAPEAAGSQLDPARVCDHSACGTVSDVDGKPVKDAWIQVVRSDDVVDEPSTLGAEGGWVLHMREENAGPRPWQLAFGAPGYVSQTLDVPDPLPEEGAKMDVQLAPEDG